ncbi:MAG: cation:proton antiporter [Anaerolineales bacterium]
MSPFLQLALALAVMILLAKAGGYISYRFGQPAVLGELLMGIILGPSVINFLHTPIFTDAHLEQTIAHLGELGVILLMFLAGLELHLSELAKSTKVAILAGTLGVVIPILLGVGLGILFSINLTSALFLGLTLAATSVSISAQTLIELNRLRSKVGIGLLSAAVFDDILVVLGLSAFTALMMPQSTSGWMVVLIVIARMSIYLLLASLIGNYLLPQLTHKVYELEISQGLIAFVFVTILLYGWLAETLGQMAAITGAFLAGLWFGRTSLRDRIISGISTIAYGIFVPIFFIDVGLKANARVVFEEDIFLFLSLVVIAILGKVVGVGLGGLLSGFTHREALQLGVGMMSRGEVGLIVASVGLNQGLIDSGAFSSIIGVVIVTTLLTPPLLRYLFVQHSDQQSIKITGSETK